MVYSSHQLCSGEPLGDTSGLHGDKLSNLGTHLQAMLFPMCLQREYQCPERFADRLGNPVGWSPILLTTAYMWCDTIP